MRILSLAILLGTSVLLAQPRVSYSSFFGGSGQEIVTASAVDEQGRIWVTGYTLSSDLPISNAPYRQVRPGQRDIFVAGLDPARTGADSLFYSTYIGGAGSEEPTCITVTGGFVYIGGFTNSIDFPLGGSAFQGSPADNQNGFVLKLNPALGGDESMAYSTYLGGAAFDRVNAIAVRNNLIYVAGYTTSENFPTSPNALGNASRGRGDAFVTVLNPNVATPAESLVFSTLLSGVATDSATAIGVNSLNEIYVAGFTASADFTATLGAYQGGFQGGTDGFLVRINANRSRVYSSFFGGAEQDVPTSLAIAGNETVVLGGYTLSGNLPTTDGAPYREARGNGDAFVARFNLDNSGPGQLTFSSLMGGENGDVITSVSPGPNNTIVVSGYTLSDRFPVTGSTLQQTNGGAIDAFVARLDPIGRAVQHSTFFGGGSVDNAVGAHSVNACEVVFAGQTQSKSLPKTESAFQPDLNGLSDAFVAKANLCPANP